MNVTRLIAAVDALETFGALARGNSLSQKELAPGMLAAASLHRILRHGSPAGFGGATACDESGAHDTRNT